MRNAVLNGRGQNRSRIHDVSDACPLYYVRRCGWFSVNWNQSYSECLSAAKQQRRPLIVLLEDPKRTELRGDSLFTNNWNLLDKFELCRVDATSSYGKKIAELYGASTLPYTVITDSECREIRFRGAGKFSNQSWRETLTRNLPSDVLIADSSVIATNHGDQAFPDESIQNASNSRDSQSNRAVFPAANLSDTLQQAHEADQTTLVFVSMDGCHYCDKMRDETFGDQQLISAISRYQTVMIKRELNAEWVEEQDVKLFPTTLVISADGKVADRIEGFMSAAKFRARIIGNRELAMLGELY